MITSRFFFGTAGFLFLRLKPKKNHLRPQFFFNLSLAADCLSKLRDVFPEYEDRRRGQKLGPRGRLTSSCGAFLQTKPPHIPKILKTEVWTWKEGCYIVKLFRDSFVLPSWAPEGGSPPPAQRLCKFKVPKAAPSNHRIFTFQATTRGLSSCRSSTALGLI